MVLDVIGMCLHVCGLAGGAYRIQGVAWNRFVRRVGSGYLRKLRMLGKQEGLLSSSSKDFFRI